MYNIIVVPAAILFSLPPVTPMDADRACPFFMQKAVKPVVSLLFFNNPRLCQHPYPQFLWKRMFERSKAAGLTRVYPESPGNFRIEWGWGFTGAKSIAFMQAGSPR
jgi:hypothetical protein